MLEVIVACFVVLLLFLRFRSVFFYLAERMPARGWLREWLRLAPRFWAILSARGAHLLQAAFENSKLFFGIAVSSLLRAAIPSARSSFDARARAWHQNEVWALGVCVRTRPHRATRQRVGGRSDD